MLCYANQEKSCDKRPRSSVPLCCAEMSCESALAIAIEILSPGWFPSCPSIMRATRRAGTGSDELFHSEALSMACSQWRSVSYDGRLCDQDSWFKMKASCIRQPSQNPCFISCSQSSPEPARPLAHCAHEFAPSPL
jgi:hypothetical protein